MSMSTETPPHLKTNTDLRAHYRAYIHTINNYAQSFKTFSHNPQSSAQPTQSTQPLDPFLSSITQHNSKPLTRAEYHALILPGSIFEIVNLVVQIGEDHRPVTAAARPGTGAGEKPQLGEETDTAGAELQVAARLRIELEDGRVVREHVFYGFDREGKIVWVESMVEGL